MKRRGLRCSTRSATDRSRLPRPIQGAIPDTAFLKYAPSEALSGADERRGHVQTVLLGIQHAERLLNLGPALNGGWAIDKNSEYYYDKENGIRLKANTGDSAKA